MSNKIFQRAAIKRVHYISGLSLSFFIAAHLFNHFCALAGPDQHIQVMESLRKIYRHPVVETFLLLAVVFQVVTGVRLVYKRRAKSLAEKIQVWSGLYLSFFLLVHVGAVISGRYIQYLDTNFYYAAAGLNLDPAYYFFIPYYFLGVVAVSWHLAAIHFLKTGGKKIALVFGLLGVIAAVVILQAFTDNFKGLPIPQNYIDFMKSFSGGGG